MVLDQDSTECPGQDDQDNAQEQTALGQRASFENVDDEREPQSQSQPQPQPQPVQGPHLEADVRTSYHWLKIY
jgi:hypothetical protein